MRLAAGALALGLLAGACGQDTADPAAGPSTTPSATPSPPASTAPPTDEASGSGPRRATRIQVADSPYGPMLYDAAGQAIYLFDKERTPRPECYGACAEAWPPVLTAAAPNAVGDTRPALLGTTERRDGSLQVTYAGHPLYFYAHEGPHQVLCHDVEEYGGTWLVVQPDGRPAPP